MANAASERRLDEELPPAPREVRLAAYAEDDEAATQLVEPLHSDPRWLVQLTPFDRRPMATAELVAALLGARLPAGSRVWREGMLDWVPLEQLRELMPPASGVRPVSGARSDLALPARALGVAPPRAGGVRAAHVELGLALAAALLALSATLALLFAGGVFDTAPERPAAAPDVGGRTLRVDAAPEAPAGGSAARLGP